LLTTVYFRHLSKNPFKNPTLGKCKNANLVPGLGHCLVRNDFLIAANLLECVKVFWHTHFDLGPLVSPLWPLLHSGWPVPIITKSFSLLFCQYARYMVLCWAKALLKMKLVRHTSYTL